ncbi:Mrp/NBP35 family ATP-binding protein [Parerythrobacter jejuensis]|uniref:Iron-sulfur cluster carrier protein n=1 Tax=Parerythrobacter jejuensis TaxID=795812 RepID=A0A845AS20_9SPHN|nr:Mrp/NBP35 family ATP-binding protein [Parerythrobacter jejuensis]MXP31306.1 P-loop NTPase [Parerythrobacter jejuensis]MXP34066.1 P-loop NTPase [Parerythrobacter jejuensis]
MLNETILKSALPEAIAARVSSLLVKPDAVTAVLDGTGLDGKGRADLEAGAKQALEAVEGVSEARIAVMAERVDRRFIAIGSGKGGVGKSTLTANLAVALKRMGHNVGVVDADIYGPSQPTLLASEKEKPEAVEQTLQPVRGVMGIPMLSMGHLIAPGKAIAWRGPMAAGALTQLVEADWGDADIILMDLPPGTGDVQLTMVQKHKPQGAIIVSTPQDLALIDAARAGQLFETAGVPVIGLVENMAGYACPHCGEVSDPFGQGGVEKIAERLELPFLGRIPLTMAIREASDKGTPPAADDGDAGAAFTAIAAQLSDWLRQGQAA